MGTGEGGLDADADDGDDDDGKADKKEAERGGVVVTSSI